MRGNAGREWDWLFVLAVIVAAGKYVFERIAAGEYTELALTGALVAVVICCIVIAVQIYGGATA